MSEQRFGIVITAKAKHGDLWGVVKKLGTAADLARHLGVDQSSLGRWINLRSAPTPNWLESDGGKAVLGKLFVLCGKTADELWPVELRAAIIGGAIGQKIERHHDIEMRALAAAFQDRLVLPAPDEVLIEKEGGEAGEVTSPLLRFLNKRHRQVIEYRFGLNGVSQLSMEETGKKMGISRERVRQLEVRALRKMKDHGWTLDPAVQEKFGVYVTEDRP